MVDIDGTICYTNGNNYESSEPRYDRIKRLNKLFDEGNEIHYWTARGAKSGKDWTEFTKNQLAEWGVFYHELTLGKPHFDLFVDDKCLNNEDWYNSEGLEV